MFLDVTDFVSTITNLFDHYQIFSDETQLEGQNLVEVLPLFRSPSGSKKLRSMIIIEYLRGLEF